MTNLIDTSPPGEPTAAALPPVVTAAVTAATTAAVTVTNAPADRPVSIELGSALLDDEAVAELADGSVVTLDRRAEDPVDIVVSGRLIARGELLVIDEQIAVRIVELIQHSRPPGL